MNQSTYPCIHDVYHCCCYRPRRLFASGSSSSSPPPKKLVGNLGTAGMRLSARSWIRLGGKAENRDEELDMTLPSTSVPVHTTCNVKSHSDPPLVILSLHCFKVL
mmetsp:Transcript_21000/g.37928  ORF Transcript_21000/g.37928 Transcript_21000/m.37928 type:complete len:105 (+) Transcript_21000:268-582(+)